MAVQAQQQKAAARRALDALEVSQIELADERKKCDRQRLKILELEQQIRTLRKVPPLWQVLQKVKAGEGAVS